MEAEAIDKLIGDIDTRISDSRRYTLSSAEYSKSTYRAMIDKLNEARGMLAALHIAGAAVDFAGRTEQIDAEVYALEAKIAHVSGYNGWSNYETWCASLWIDNEYGTYQQVTEQAEESDDAYTLAKWLEGEFGSVPDGVDGMYSDLLGSAINSIDWTEVAEAHKPDEGWLSDRPTLVECDNCGEEFPEDQINDNGLCAACQQDADIEAAESENETSHDGKLFFSLGTGGSPIYYLTASDFDYDWRNDHNTYSRE